MFLSLQRTGLGGGNTDLQWPGSQALAASVFEQLSEYKPVPRKPSKCLWVAFVLESGLSILVRATHIRPDHKSLKNGSRQIFERRLGCFSSSVAQRPCPEDLGTARAWDFGGQVAEPPPSTTAT